MSVNLYNREQFNPSTRTKFIKVESADGVKRKITRFIYLKPRTKNWYANTVDHYAHLLNHQIVAAAATESLDQLSIGQRPVNSCPHRNLQHKILFLQAEKGLFLRCRGKEIKIFVGKETCKSYSFSSK